MRTMILGTAILLMNTATAFAAEVTYQPAQPIQMSEAQMTQPLPSSNPSLRMSQRDPVLVAPTPAPTQAEDHYSSSSLMRFNFGI